MATSAHLLTVVLSGCTARLAGGSPQTASGADASDDVSLPLQTNSGDGATPVATCALAMQGNTATVVQAAQSQPGWVQMDLSILVDADASATPADIESRLQGTGAQNIRWDSFIDAVDATVIAADVPQIACWPGVVELSGNALGCAGSCTDPCFVQCGPSCTPLVGTRIDVAAGCVIPNISLGCIGNSAASGEDLTCYIELSTGDAFAVNNPFLVAAGDTAVRTCSPQEGGSQSPTTLPNCP